MARMHPEDIDDPESATAGERKVFRFLQAVARPDSDFIGWYEPTINPMPLTININEIFKSV